MHRLEIMERREEDLKRQVTDKSRHITQLAERIAVRHRVSLKITCNFFSVLLGSTTYYTLSNRKLKSLYKLQNWTRKKKKN